MTQYSANPKKEKIKLDPKKGSLVLRRHPNSPHFFFAIEGGGTIPAMLDGAWISQTDAINAQKRYVASKRKPKAGDSARQESDVIIAVTELKNVKVAPPASISAV